VIDTAWGAVMVTIEVTLAEELATDVALMVTVLPVGGVAGAVYVVAVPLAVAAGLNEPQFELPQLTDQLTPLFEGSLATVAVTDAVLPAGTVDGTCEKVTVTGGDVICIVADADFVLSALAVTVIVT
jgi:hypothetical protein